MFGNNDKLIFPHFIIKNQMHFCMNLSIYQAVKRKPIAHKHITLDSMNCKKLKKLFWITLKSYVYINNIKLTQTC